MTGADLFTFFRGVIVGTVGGSQTLKLAVNKAVTANQQTSSGITLARVLAQIDLFECTPLIIGSVVLGSFGLASSANKLRSAGLFFLGALLGGGINLVITNIYNFGLPPASTTPSLSMKP